MTKLDKYLKEVRERCENSIYLFGRQVGKSSFLQHRQDVEVLLKMLNAVRLQRNEAIAEASYTEYDNCEDMHILDADLELESIIPGSEGE